MAPITSGVESNCTNHFLDHIPCDCQIQVEKTSHLKGEITVPASKSYTHRMIIIGSMNGKSVIHNFLDSEDNRNTINAWINLGAKIKEEGRSLHIEGFNGKPNFQTSEINVGEAGTLLRFILSVVALGKGTMTITGKDTLLIRKNTTMVRALDKLGVEISSTGADHRVPITINAKGKLVGGKVKVRGDITSQLVSSLLIALPRAVRNSTIIIENPEQLVSRPYIDVTIDVLRKAGITVTRTKDFSRFEVEGRQRFTGLNEVVPGDWSSAAFPIAAASLIESDVKINGLDYNNAQGDKAIVDIINEMGGNVIVGSGHVKIKGPFKLHGIKVDCRDTPDIVPVVAVLAAHANGETRITNIGHLRHKESDRIKSIKDEFVKLGIDIKTKDDEIIITGSPDSVIKSNQILYPHSDHRIAMCLSLIGLRNGDMKIENAKCIEKSYPEFINHMQQLGAKIELQQ